MKKLDILFHNKCDDPTRVPFNIKIESNMIIVTIYIRGLSNYSINKKIAKISNLLSIYSNIEEIVVTFDKEIDNICIYNITASLHDIIYNYTKNPKISVNGVDDNILKFIELLTKYKDIAMEPNKTPTSYMDWLQANIPVNYTYTKEESPSDFPLTRAVGIGSQHPYYFIHIYPRNIDSTKKTFYFIGKAVTYDSGGLNLKNHTMAEMKVDMIGSGIIMAVLNMIAQYNIVNLHILIPVVENMIGPNATKPGTIVKSKNGKTIELTNMDAEGRLCIADCLEYINNIVLKDPTQTKPLVVDIATLTGNASSITCCVSGISMSNKMGRTYNKMLIKCGEETGEYVDYLKLREEYRDMIQSNVADLNNSNKKLRADCILGGVFLNEFIDPSIPWIHIDVANVTYKNNMVTSFGINLLYRLLLNCIAKN